MSAVALSVVNSITATANQTAVGGTANDPIIAIATNPVLPGSGSVTVPSGNTAARVLTLGALRLNTQTGFFECSADGATWVNLAVGGGGIASVTGTAGQIDVTAGVNPVISIDPAYIGQTSITTLGTIGTGIWNGTNIALAHGGTSASLVADNGALVYSTGGALSLLASTATANQIPLSGAHAAPTWSTATYPATTTLNQILYSSAANVIAGIAATANGTLITGAAGIPSIAALTNGTILIGTAGAPAASTATYPATTTINQLLYSSAANTIGGLATANGGMLITSHTGVPSIQAMTDGQVMIGSTAGLPQPAQILNGTGITVTSASNSITITNSGVTSNVATANQTTVSGATGAVTIGIANNPILPGTGGVTVPAGTTIQEAGGAGTIRYNTTTSLTELTNDGATWHALSIAGGTVTSVTASSPLASSGGTTPNITLNSVVPLNLGGTFANLTASNGGIVWSNATQMQILAGTATANQLLLSGSTATPAWSTSTYPATNAINTLLYASAANTMSALATANDGLLVTSNTGVPSILAGPGTTGNILQSNSAAAPSFSTSTYPSTNAINTLLYASAANTMSALATANNGTLITSNTGVPSISSTLPAAVQGNITATGALGAGSLAAGFTAVTVPLGGTGNTTFTAYSVICAGTTATGTFQNVVGVGSANQVLTSNGAGALPTWQPATGGSGGAKVWVVYNTIGAAVTNQASFNVSSLTYNGVGNVTIAYTAGFGSSAYVVNVSGVRNNAQTPQVDVAGIDTVNTNRTTAHVIIQSVDSDFTGKVEYATVSVVCYGT